MTVRTTTKLLREGEFIAEVEVKLLYEDDSWSPYLSLEDAYKLDDVRSALRAGDIKAASRIANVYTLSPLVA